MANTKKDTTKIEEVENKETQNIDMEKMIQEAIAKAVAETSQKYESQISELKEQLESKEDENSDIPNIVPDKMVWIQHMGAGGAGFHKGRINVTFDKLFDRKRVKWEVLDEMYYEFRRWFEEFEIVILDDEVRKYYGIDEAYKEKGADEKEFEKMLKMSTSAMIDEINKFSFIVATAFLKFFMTEYKNGNSLCLKDNKLKAVQEFYHEHYNITNLKELMSEMDFEE